MGRSTRITVPEVSHFHGWRRSTHSSAPRAVGRLRRGIGIHHFGVHRRSALQSDIIGHTMESLRSLATALAIPERTLRRAAADGLLHGQRPSPRRFRVSAREELYLRDHWGLLQSLRAALRTEPNVRLAVLFGSTATGTERGGSDIDVLVDLDDPAVSRLADIAGRLTGRVGREVQLVRLPDAQRTPVLMLTILRDGRVLIDRDERWVLERAQLPKWQRRARATERPLEEALEDLSAEGSAPA
jgi:predicted nucleotidyltransferase